MLIYTLGKIQSELRMVDHTHYRPTDGKYIGIATTTTASAPLTIQIILGRLLRVLTVYRGNPEKMDRPLTCTLNILTMGLILPLITVRTLVHGLEPMSTLFKPIVPTLRITHGTKSGVRMGRTLGNSLPNPCLLMMLAISGQAEAMARIR